MIIISKCAQATGAKMLLWILNENISDIGNFELTALHSTTPHSIQKSIFSPPSLKSKTTVIQWYGGGAGVDPPILKGGF